MIGVVFVILFALSFSCEGEIYLPAEENKFVVEPGTDVEIEWTFDDTIKDVLSRVWISPSGEVIVRITDDGKVEIREPGQKLGANVTKPATLSLKNVDLRHNGTYKFQITAKKIVSSDVMVLIKVNSSVTQNCSSVVRLDEGGDVRCLCKAEGENPPVNMSVTWYKDGKQFGPTRYEENMLSLLNVKATDTGTYKCVAKGDYNLTGESKSTEVIVRLNFAPNVTSFSATTAVLGKPVTITCEANGLPEPTYTIYHNGTNVSTDMTYYIPVVNASHDGLYKCVAKNKLGNSSKTITLDVEASPTTTTSKPTKASGMPSMPSTSTISVGPPKKTDDDDGPSTGLIAGIVIGVLLFLLILVFFLWWFKYRKEKSSGEHIGNDVVPGNQGNAPVPENAYESLADGEGKKPENLYDEARLGNDNGGAGSTSDNLPPVYATVDKDKKKNKKKDKKKNEPAPANTPPVYATVDKTRHNEPSVTYATLDTVAMQPTGSSKRDRRDQPTEYASIAEFGVKGDLV